MVSMWWVALAFVGGGWAGMLVMALMRLSGDLDRGGLDAEDALENDLRRLQHDDEIVTNSRYREAGLDTRPCSAADDANSIARRGSFENCEHQPG